MKWYVQASTEAFLGTSGTGRSVRRSRATSLAQQSAVGKLITFLARQGQPDPLLAVLRAVDTDAQPLPVETMQDTDAEGRSFLTRWLPSWIQAQQPSAPSMPEGGQVLCLPSPQLLTSLPGHCQRHAIDPGVPVGMHVSLPGQWESKGLIMQP